MTQKSLQFIRNSIFTVTATLAAVIVTLPGGASELSVAEKLGAFSGLVTTADYNPALVQQTGYYGDRYRVNPDVQSQSELAPRNIFSVQFDQKNLLPISASANSGLKKRTDLTFDRDRSLLADFKLSSKN